MEQSSLGLRCLIADRSAIFALGLEAALDSDSVTVVGRVDEPSGVDEFLLHERVDVVLSCFEPPVDAINVAGRVDSCPVLVLSSLVVDAMVIEALRVGARGVLTKDASRAELLTAISRVAKGDTVLPAGWEHIVPRIIEEREGGRKGSKVLTKREEEVMRQLIRGYSNKQLARHLGIAEQTVKNHIHHIMAKLEVSSRVQLCRWAMGPPGVRQLSRREGESLSEQ